MTTTTTWAYEGLTLLSLFATRGAEAWSVTYLSDDAGRAYAGLYRAGTSATPFLLSTSDRSDVIALTDVSGVPFASHRYDPWGVITSSLTTATASMDASLAARIAERQPLRYAGYVHDAESRMYYCSARTYDPTTRQFLSKDPAKDDGEESAYQYCGGDPINRIDPSGLASYDEFWVDVTRYRGKAIDYVVDGTKYRIRCNTDDQGDVTRGDMYTATWGSKFSGNDVGGGVRRVTYTKNWMWHVRLELKRSWGWVSLMEFRYQRRHNPPYSGYTRGAVPNGY